MLKNTIYLLLMLFVAITAIGCAAEDQQSPSEAEAQVSQAAEGTKIITDLLDRQVAVSDNPQTIAAIPGPTYEMAFLLGSGDDVAMVKNGHTSDYPLALMTNPNLANLAGIAANPSSSVNIEDYLAKEIDLVLYYDNSIELEKFDAVNMPAIVVTKNAGLLDSLEEVQAQSLDQFIETFTEPLSILADALGTEEAAAEYADWKAYCDEKLRMIHSRTADLSEEERPTVYWGNTWGEEIRSSYSLKNRYYEIYLAGGTLIGPTDGSNFPEVTAEQLYDWDPDIIFVDNHGGMPELVMASMYKEDSRWAPLSAVQNEQLYQIPSGIFFLDKGTTTTLFVLWSAKNLHPDLFADIDLVAEFQHYYQEFYEYDLSAEDAQKIIEGWVEYTGADKLPTE